ncbi:SDR family oxidoreductase [Lentilactobacillus parakefiri]|uniref:3-beta hydroxysteroid dehydrogenase n=1 Tax=Lentilactobacillus parakefiri TaxID=152332 RepID=A0A269YNU4_9LACO|nr:SDR family oxidoreductase [Lentilactobacillus parakefiri]PAK87237.1 3-beta hydroxysteroid dehydrogenase [Lentilactobacillus parakefiri]
MVNRLTNKVAIITGGISGIGKAVAQDFLSEGAKVVITGRRESLGNTVAKELGGPDEIQYMKQDVSREADWQRVVDQTIKQFGGFDILVNNAGVGGAGKMIAQTSLEEWQQVMDIDLTGNFLGVREALNKMDKGSIVNISSILGIITPMPGAGSYSAAKEAVKMGKSIRVNSVHPGLVSTDIVDSQTKAYLENSDVPIPKIGSPVNIAKAVTYLASDESEYTTGSEIVIDGGSLAGRG